MKGYSFKSDSISHVQIITYDISELFTVWTKTGVCYCTCHITCQQIASLSIPKEKNRLHIKCRTNNTFTIRCPIYKNNIIIVT